MNNIILYCRPGFEKECAAEFLEKNGSFGIPGKIKADTDSGHVVFTYSKKGDSANLYKKTNFRNLVFSRQMFSAYDEITDLPKQDRISPIMEILKDKSFKADEVFVETSDAETFKPILPFCKSFSLHFTKALQNEGMLNVIKSNPALRLHLFFLTSDRVFAGISRSDNSSPWYMGIPRLKFPGEAPSRSTLKLEEALLVFLTPLQREKMLRPGLSAIDLGASPGGWTYQLIKRGMKVTAVDNGTMDKSIMRSGLVRHIRADGFAFKPEKPVDWMVCDIVEQPSRIACLVAQWMSKGWCRHSIFNLKLPMKKRHEEVKRCVELIDREFKRSKTTYSLQIKHLYHDREEVTGYLSRLNG
jgi:23S rRNA (cytidine2498-2'-O)-methyltransferase